ncbi:hypothetical protein CY34DRAFT_12539 [Suillus luteus UH-Slu-Lm8-n1]|uniref:Unplaced genomic scaffold CY34scaffold_115, whole genome shotgun sequence n=1 Tax=Suillus luteus UH-Slu-Lm8-n1 TaxID=930992 RepID=A0A0D0AJX5_9AGAM|nr:hypothetical protein CY34DRAFT_12539 [Suillus luteus UH-Slu-Lm8-n1]
MLGVIIITRLHAMYQQSRKMLIFLVVVFLAVTTCCGYLLGKATGQVSGEELVLSGTYECTYRNSGTGVRLLTAGSWILVTVWELLTLCLAVWIVIKHFRGLRRPATGCAVRDCFTALIQTHMFYFVAFAAVSCLVLGLLSPILVSYSVGAQLYLGLLQIFISIEMFVLGPRLILGIRGYYHAELRLADTSEATDMVTPVFEEHTSILTGSDV